MHALRHYAATAWLSSGAATVRDVADLLGHSSPTVTLDIYAAAIPGAQRAAVESAAAALGGRPSKRPSKRASGRGRP